jgi:polar amino acid transport system substrate-binding protein
MVTIIKRLATVLLILVAANSVFAQAKQEKLRVATRLVKPFVYDEGGTLTGFSVELWHELSRQLKMNSDFVVKASVKDLLQAVKSKEVHLGISAVSITAEREIDFDFSQPMFDAGLQILTPAQGSKSGLISTIAAGIFSSSVLPIIGVVLLIILVPAHLVWFFERRNATGLLTHRSYFPGILEACWWAASTLATLYEMVRRQRIVTGLISVSSLGFSLTRNCDNRVLTRQGGLVTYESANDWRTALCHLRATPSSTVTDM